MLTLRNKIAQMLIMGFSGTELQEQGEIAQWLSHERLGGVLLFDRDVLSGTHGKNLQHQAQIKKLTHQLQEYSAKTEANKEHDLPLFVAIDYEGGALDQLTHIEGCMHTMTAADMAKLAPDALDAELSQMAETLHSLGFNLNFAPVVDLHMHEEQGIIGALQRSFSADPEVVGRVAHQFVEVFSRYGIATSYKHFPGHGSALGDTHEGFVDVTNTYDPAELLPYQHLIKDSYLPVMIMTAHVINRNLDSSGLPATLSHSILTGLLREKMGYNGVIIADDLQMQSISNHYSMEEALKRTINAGSDMLIISNQWAKHSAPELIEIIERLVLEQKIDMERIESAYQRIVRLKQQMVVVGDRVGDVVS